MEHSVLVTGGAGYIGSHAVLALRGAGYRVIVVDDLSTGHRRAVPDDVAFAEGDIADASLVARLLVDHRVRAIMHFAGSIIVPESVENPLKYYHNNTVKTCALLATAVGAGVPHFIFSSTAAVYGMPETVPVPEDASKAPINPYGTSKLMSEMMLADIAQAHPINYAALRYFNVAGADPAGRSGQSTANATHLIKVAVEAALGKRGGVAVFGTDFDTPDGSGVRDYIHVSDLADAHVAALQHLETNPAESVTLNCGYRQGYSVLDVLDAVERVSGTRLSRRMEARRSGDPAQLIAENARILETLDWTPRLADLDTIVAHALAWERQLP